MNNFNLIWLPFLYLYIVGGGFFLLGLILIIKTNAIEISKPDHFNWLLILIIGFVYYFLIHFLFIIFATGN